MWECWSIRGQGSDEGAEILIIMMAETSYRRRSHSFSGAMKGDSKCHKRISSEMSEWWWDPRGWGRECAECSAQDVHFLIIQLSRMSRTAVAAGRNMKFERARQRPESGQKAALRMGTWCLQGSKHLYIWWLRKKKLYCLLWEKYRFINSAKKSILDSRSIFDSLVVLKMIVNIFSVPRPFRAMPI